MAEDSKNLDDNIDQLEEGAKKYASKDTVISIGGYEFTPAKLMVAFTLVSSIVGGLYSAFLIYQDYMNMKQAIQEYVAPDLSAINEKLSVLQKQMEGTKSSVMQSTDYTNEIKNDLKSDIRRLESVVENLERSTKQSQREVDETVKIVNKDMNKLERDTATELRSIRAEVDSKIKKALDNPLAGK